MTKEQLQTITDTEGPLSYADVRRLVLLMTALLVGAYLLWAIGPTLLLFVFIFYLAMVLNAPVTWLERHGVARGLGVVLVIFIVLLIVGLLIALIVPTMLEQINEFTRKAPEYSTRIHGKMEGLLNRYPDLDAIIPEQEAIMSQAGGRAQGALQWLLSRTFGVIGGIFIGFIALLLLIFILTNPSPLVAGFLCAVPERHREATGRSIARIMDQMTVWTKATLINGLITGVSTGLLLYFIGVQPAFLFGALAFFGEFVPNIGPLAAALPALFVALGTGVDKFLWALAAVFFVQQVESNVLVPYIMGKQLKLHPLTIVFFALSMGSLFNLVGAILAVPMAITVKILFEEFYLKPQKVPVEEIEARTDKLVSRCLWDKPDAQEDAPEEDKSGEEPEDRDNEPAKKPGDSTEAPSAARE